jgi:hypothetical protein
LLLCIGEMTSQRLLDHGPQTSLATPYQASNHAYMFPGYAEPLEAPLVGVEPPTLPIGYPFMNRV